MAGGGRSRCGGPVLSAGMTSASLCQEKARGSRDGVRGGPDRGRDGGDEQLPASRSESCHWRSESGPRLVPMPARGS